ncbi:very short patch repair endonuclease [Flavobacterium longum]|uniref:very short patch repair endonuclease n=1 Tax=Flavobacterium longum TaxID=1299340 RepID=UPI0039E98F9B
MDKLSKDQRSKLMGKIRGKNTKPEIRLAKSLYHRGHRYRKHNKKILGTPDLTFAKYRIAIFVDSEFFHGKHWHVVEKRPKSNAEFWQKKIERNIARDKEVNEYLENQGWTVLRFWSEEIKKNLDEVVATIERIIIMKKSKVVNIYPDDDLPLNAVAETKE